MTLKAPFPYFGGKSKVAPMVWDRLGNVDNYVEPFCGSCAMLLARPDAHAWWEKIETVNDVDGLLSNCWRAIKMNPKQLAYYADDIVSECDLHARHCWLVERKDSLAEQLMGDPEFYDAKAAGWWLWGISCWIASGWCAGNGPWRSVNGRLVNTGEAGGVGRKLPHLGDAGTGIHRSLPHLSDAGTGIHRGSKRNVYGYMEALASRLRTVRVCCGDWARVCGPSPTVKHGLTGVYLDPPYSQALRDKDIYVKETDCLAAVREWAVEWGEDPQMRIAVSGYRTEHNFPESWEMVRWKGHPGYSVQRKQGVNENRRLECVWFSPNCLKPTLFGFSPSGEEDER